MDLFSMISVKHRTRIIYIFVALMMFTVISFALASFFADGLISCVYVLAVLLSLGLFAWALKGGTMSGCLDRNKLAVNLSEAERKEDKELPETDLRRLVIQKKKGESLD